MTNNSIKLVCFDLNETLIDENTWRELNLALGVTPEEDRNILNDYEEGRITYEEGQKILEKIYKERGKATAELIQEVISKYTYKKGVQDVVKYLRETEYQLALLSGSMNLLVEKIAAELSIPFFGANNKFNFDVHGHLSSIKVLGMDSSVKTSQLSNFCKQLSIQPYECACVGDGLSDRELFEITGHGITFKGSRIETIAWKVIEKLEDLKQIL